MINNAGIPARRSGRTIKKWILLSLAFFGLLTSSTFATIITFDDLYVSGGIPVSNPYDGLIWSNFYPQAINWFNTPDGFTNAILSGNDFVANGGGGTAQISSGLFNLNAGYCAAGWRDNLQMQVEGFLNGNLTYSNTYTLSATTGKMINFNVQGVDTVVFSASGGTQHPGYSGDGTFFAMDNLDVTIINAVLINAQPTNYTSVAGSSATFTVSAYGAPPFTYQWLFNGTNIIGATNSLLTQTNVQTYNEGEYSVVVSSLFDSITSSNATLTVTPSPPIFTTQPIIQVLTANFDVKIFAAAIGSLPIIYQWQFNETNIDGATNDAIILTNVQPFNAGYYDVIASNSYGSITSSIVTLSPANLSLISGWGDNDDENGNYAGEATPPIELAYVTTIAAGGYHSLALNQGGTVVGWGDNSYGQSTIPSGLSNMVGIAAGYYHSLALKDDGTVVAWGSNVSGETNVPAGLSNVIAIAAGGCDCIPNGNHSLALKSDGTVVGWGATTVPSGLSNVLAVAAGDNHSLALKRDGTIVGWGINYNGQATPPPGLINVVAISAGGYHSMALRIDGTVVTWGNNYYGQTNTPITLTNVVAIAAGEDFSVALQANGEVVAWGSDIAGESIVPPDLSNIVAIASGARHVLSLENDGSPYVTRQPLNWTVYSGMSVNLNVGAVGPPPINYQWQFNGTNIDGATNALLALANLQTNNAGNYSILISNSVGVVTSSNAIVTVINSLPIIVSQPTNFVATLGAASTFAASVDGSIPVSFQWQFNGTNISGATNAVLNLAPWSSEGSYSVIVSNAYGAVTSSNATLTLSRSQIVPWGSNSNGQTNIPASLGNVLAISAGGNNSMALKSDGTVVVWGYTGYGQTSVPAGLSNVVAIACGSFYDCLALKSDGTVIGWGLNGFGKTTAPAGLSNVVAIAAGDNHSLILQNNGQVVAWGSNSSGQTNVPAGLTNAAAIAAGSAHNLALRSDGTVIAWGSNSSGQTNVPLSLTNAVAIAACGNDSVALRSDGTVAAWGDNSYGQTNVPVGLTNTMAIAAGSSHNLALRSDGTVVAWGNNSSGQTNVPVGLGKVVALAAGQSHSLALVSDGPLVVATQPLNQTTYAGMMVFFTANVLGLRPLVYQWQFNGTNIDGATNALLTLMNVQPTNTGSYNLVISNAFGTITSSNASLTVVAVPPTLVLQPTNQVALPGSNATFTVAAGTGPIPIFYQWQFNGTNIAGATNDSLTLTNVQFTNQGIYQVVVSNAFGTTISSNATLTVVDLATALNAPDLVWTNGGSAAWFAETSVTHDGVAAAQSGAIARNQTSTLQTSVTGPGTLTFWWRFSQSPPDFDSLNFYVNGGRQAFMISPFDWQQNTFYLGSGTQALQWTYSRSFLNSGNMSTGWVDQVTFTPGGTPLIITLVPTNQFLMTKATANFVSSAKGTPPIGYQWQFNGTNLARATNSSLTIASVQPTNSGTYTLTITNPYGSFVTNVTLFVQPFALNTASTNLWLTTSGLLVQVDGVLTPNALVIYASTNLTSWLPILTNPPATGSVQVLDSSATNLPFRFYRAGEQ